MIRSMLKQMVVVCGFLSCLQVANEAKAYYAQAQGRFISRDPIGYPDGMNSYAGYFVPNSVDPNGTDLGPVVSDNWPNPVPPPDPGCMSACTSKSANCTRSCYNSCVAECREVSKDNGRNKSCKFDFTPELRQILQEMKDRMDACCAAGAPNGNSCYGYTACMNATNLSNSNYKIDTHGGKLWWGFGGVVDQGYLITDSHGQQLYVHPNPRGLGLCPTFRVDCYPDDFIWE